MEVRHTFASVLKECTRITSDRCKEIKMLQQLVQGGGDPSMISRIKDQKQEEEQMRELKRMREKYFDALLSRKNAILAKRSILSNTKLQAEKVREEVTSHFNQYCDKF
ncbi:hypothetical protein P5V15_006657 [Pogonomyrmex californicus]